MIADYIQENLQYDDYTPFEGYEEDADIAAESTCENCGHVGLGYSAFKREDPGFQIINGTSVLVPPHMRRRSYIAIATCPICLHQEEF